MDQQKPRRGWVAVILLVLIGAGTILIFQELIPTRFEAPLDWLEDIFQTFENWAKDMSRWFEEQFSRLGENLGW